MEQTSFELTPKQKGILATLSRETGKPVPALLDAALEALQEHERLDHAKGETNGNGHEVQSPLPPPQEARKPIWEALIEASLEIPEEELALLPPDGATQHDHYIYGIPEHPA